MVEEGEMHYYERFDAWNFGKHQAMQESNRDASLADMSQYNK